jgi:integrating conjugative element membrane protein (TIGR03747 family)
MATQTRRTGSAQQSAEHGIIATFFIKLLQAIVFLLLTLFFSILIEWAGMAFDYWEPRGVKHSETMLDKELGYLNQDFKRSVIVEKPAEFARHFADSFYDWTFKKTGVQAAIIWLATPVPGVDDKPFRKRLHRIFKALQEYVLAAITVTQIFAVRLAILILAFPAFILLALVGLIDGLVQRDIRRWSGGRETSFVYHWAKKILYPSLILPWIIYLAMPESVHPNYVVLPFAVLFALSVTVMASTFKKYL